MRPTLPPPSEDFFEWLHAASSNLDMLPPVLAEILYTYYHHAIKRGRLMDLEINWRIAGEASLKQRKRLEHIEMLHRRGPISASEIAALAKALKKM